MPEIPLPALYYQNSSKAYWRMDKKGRLIQVDKEMTRKFLAQSYSIVKNPATGLAMVDEIMLKIQEERNVAYAGPLAGYHAGYHEMNGEGVLVTNSPKFITPVAGEWPILASIREKVKWQSSLYDDLWVRFSIEQPQVRQFLYDTLYRNAKDRFSWTYQLAFLVWVTMVRQGKEPEEVKMNDLKVNLEHLELDWKKGRLKFNPGSFGTLDSWLAGELEKKPNPANNPETKDQAHLGTTGDGNTLSAQPFLVLKTIADCLIASAL
jgi:hypothetical protein